MAASRCYSICHLSPLAHGVTSDAQTGGTSESWVLNLPFRKPDSQNLALKRLGTPEVTPAPGSGPVLALPQPSNRHSVLPVYVSDEHI